MKRLKRALAAFLKDELLEWAGYKHTHPLSSRLAPEIRVDKIEFDTLYMEEVIEFGQIDKHGAPFSYQYEDVIRKMKKRFADEVMNHIHVDAKKLFDHDHFADQRSIMLSLRVQKKQKS